MSLEMKSGACGRDKNGGVLSRANVMNNIRILLLLSSSFVLSSHAISQEALSSERLERTAIGEFIRASCDSNHKCLRMSKSECSEVVETHYLACSEDVGGLVKRGVYPEVLEQFGKCFSDKMNGHLRDKGVDLDAPC